MLIQYVLNWNESTKRYQIVRIENFTRKTEIAVFDEYDVAKAVTDDLNTITARGSTCQTNK